MNTEKVKGSIKACKDKVVSFAIKHGESIFVVIVMIMGVVMGSKMSDYRMASGLMKICADNPEFKEVLDKTMEQYKH